MAGEDFASFFDQHYGRVVRSLRLVIADRHDAEDRAQEAFTKALRRWEKVSAMERPATWVYVVALNAERRMWKRSAEQAVLPHETATADPASAIVHAVSVRDALDRLTERQRAMVVLRYFSDLTVADVARVMGCADGTVKATLHRAAQSMRADLGEQC